MLKNCAECSLIASIHSCFFSPVDGTLKQNTFKLIDVFHDDGTIKNNDLPEK